MSAYLAAVSAVLRRPELWATSVRQARLLARPRWWARAPFLPLPDRAYLRFRMLTAYGGDGSATPSPPDLVAYLQWCRAFPQVIAH